MPKSESNKHPQYPKMLERFNRLGRKHSLSIENVQHVLGE